MSKPVTLDIYVNTLGELNRTLDPEKRRRLLDELRPQLEASFKADINQKVERLVEIESNIFIETKWQFFPYFQEAIQAYVNGLFVGAVALVGICCERISSDIIELVPIEINGKKLTPADRSTFNSLSQERRIKLLEAFGIVSPDSCQKLKEVNTIRNKYVHLKVKVKDQGHSDAKRCMTLLYGLIRQIYDLRTFYDFTPNGLVPKTNLG